MPSLLTLQQELGKLSLSSSPSDGAPPRQAWTILCSFVCNKVPSLAASEKRKSSLLRLFILPALWNCFSRYFLAFSRILDASYKRELKRFSLWTLIGRFAEKQGAFFNRQAGVTLASWRRIETTRTTQRVGQPGRAGRTTAQPPPTPRGVGAREGACQALGLMHPACFALAAVRDGGDQNYLPPRRPGDTISGETVGAGGQSHSGRLQKCPQEAKLQILLQIYGRWLRVTVEGFIVFNMEWAQHSLVFSILVQLD